MEGIEEKINKTEAKIQRQKQLLIGAERMSKNYSNTQAMISQCNQEINELNRNIEFLQIQLSELELKKQRFSMGEIEEVDTSSQIELRTESRPIINTIDLRRFEESSLTIEKITFKLQEIGYKKNVELKLREGFEKLLRLYHMDPTIGDKKSRAEAEDCIQSCSQRISLLERALKRYIDFSDLSSVQVDPDGAIWKKPALRKAMTGTLAIKIIGARNLARLNDSDVFIKVKVDSNIKAQTKSLSPDKITDYFEFQIEKASELELIVFGNRFGTTPAPIGMFWLPIRELNDAIRSNVLNSSSWISKNNNGAPHPPAPRESVEGWFSVEPVGQIQLRVDFQKYSGPARRSSKLGRQGAVRKQKEPAVQHNGHSFVAKQFYSIMTCALCGEFLMGGTGYQCDDCRYFCHKKCGPQVLFKCISKSHSEADAEKINHRIPHRFEMTSNFSANWCYHCGQMLPLGKKACNKCTECEVTAHTNCSHLVPNLCGLSMSQANQMLLAIRQAKQAKKAKHDSVPPIKSKSKMDQEVALPNVKRTKIEDFDFLAVLGRGNFGKVMLSREKATSNLFAIKVLKKDMIVQSKEVEGLKSERRVFMTANQDRHPFLLGLHSCFQSPTRIYFVMEYISGGDLMWHIQRKPFTANQAKFYAVEVLLGLDHLHKNKIIYRDLKLDNILLDLDGHIRIADYGLCKENMGYGAITHTFCGTPEFLAPEILQEQGYGRAVDWWAFGVLLYEMRLGQSPFYGSEEDEVYDSILEDDVLYPYNLERETVSILQKLLTREPRYRLGGGPEDAEELKRHTYFKGVVWEDFLAKRVTPPLKPTINKPDDISNFDDLFTSEKPILTPIEAILSPADQNEFNGFSYTADWVGPTRES